MFYLKKYLIYAYSVKDHWKICNACLKITEFILEFNCEETKLVLLRALFSLFLENNLKLEYTSSLDYIKNYLDLLKSNAQDELQVFEVPSVVLKSRILLCLANIFVKLQDFNTALEFIKLCEKKEIVQDLTVTEEANKLKILILDHIEEILLSDRKEGETQASIRLRGELVGFVREIKTEVEETEEESERHFVFSLEGSLTSEHVIQVLTESVKENDFISVARINKNLDLPVSRVKKDENSFDFIKETVSKLFEERSVAVFDESSVMKCIRMVLKKNVDTDFCFVFGRIKDDFNLYKLDEELKRVDLKVKLFFEADRTGNCFENISVAGNLNGLSVVEQINLFKEEKKPEKYLNEFYEIS